MSKDLSAMTVKIGGNDEVFAVLIEFEEAKKSSIEVIIERDMDKRMQNAFASAMNNLIKIIDQSMESVDKVEPGDLLFMDLSDPDNPA